MTAPRILGLGLDLVELERLESLLRRHERRFLGRICRPGEWERREWDSFVQHIGGLFAAKEAVLKALGTGWAAGLAPRQVEIRRLSDGAPTVELHDAAREKALSMGVESVHLSISHERRHAAAVAVLEGQPRYDDSP